MKRLLIATAIALLILAFTATAALAHGRQAMQDVDCCENGCPEPCAQVAEGRSRHLDGYHFDQSRRYATNNPALTETINGSVMDVYQTASKRGQETGLHLLLKTTDEEILDVHLGPEWYFDQQDFRLEPGDALEIQGKRFIKDETPAMIAFEVKKGAQILNLRNEDSLPQWKGSPSLPTDNL
ncbi:MAG: hypothetical protein F6K42_04420 [Leptolyngbya sp. SIO1D8]|nr:hypothetical protein [Leptolyngbya sp. SIO1D8]